MTNNDYITFGTGAYGVVVNESQHYAYIIRLADRAVTHLTATGPGEEEARALYRIYQKDPEQFETICHRQQYYEPPKWRMN